MPFPRVLMVHPAMAPYRIDLFNTLHKTLPLRVLFVQPLPPYDANLDRRALQDGFQCDHEIVAEHRAPCIVALARRMWAEVSRFRPDVLVTHEFSKASTVAAAIVRARGRQLRHVVWTTKNPLEIADAGGIRLKAIRWLAGTAAAVMTYSSESAERLANLTHSPCDRFFVCANHQDPTRLRDLARNALLSVLGTCRRLDVLDRRVVVIVSRLAAEKNIADAIAAFHQAFAADGDVCLVIIGEGPLRPVLEAAAASGPCAGRILFLGQREFAEVQAWLAVASISVLASAREPFGAVVGESLIQGTRVLCSEAVGAASLVDSASKGAVFPPGRIDVLASLLRQYRADFAPVEQIAAQPKPRIPAPVVADDVAGFVAAVSYASRGRHV